MPWKDPTRAGGAPFGIGAAFHIRVRRARRSPCRFSVSGLEGHLEPRQDEIARRVVDAVSKPNRRIPDGGLTTDKETRR